MTQEMETTAVTAGTMAEDCPNLVSIPQRMMGFTTRKASRILCLTWEEVNQYGNTVKKDGFVGFEGRLSMPAFEDQMRRIRDASEDRNFLAAAVYRRTKNSIRGYWNGVPVMRMNGLAIAHL